MTTTPPLPLPEPQDPVTRPRRLRAAVGLIPAVALGLSAGYLWATFNGAHTLNACWRL